MRGGTRIFPFHIPLEQGKGVLCLVALATDADVFTRLNHLFCQRNDCLLYESERNEIIKGPEIIEEETLRTILFLFLATIREPKLFVVCGKEEKFLRCSLFDLLFDPDFKIIVSPLQSTLFWVSLTKQVLKRNDLFEM